MLEINTIHLGNNLDLLKQLADNSVDSVVTDPPYGINFMNKKWDYDVPSVELWQEVYRVLKPGGHMLVACGTRTQHRMAVNIEDAGFEIRDIVAWVYGSGFPKSLDISKAIESTLLKGSSHSTALRQVEQDGNGESYQLKGKNNGIMGEDRTYERKEFTPSTSEAKQYAGFGTALKPSAEYWTLVQKPLESSSFLWGNDCIKEVLKCLLKSFAKIAVNHSMLNQQGQKEEFDIVQWSVENNINTPEDLLGLMVTLQSYITENTSLNIVLSWLNILAEIWKLMNTSTTKTEINLTTELKTLKSTEWGNILENITLVNNNQINGLSANVYVVESIFTVLELKLKDIQTLIAQENALSVHIDQKVNMELWTLARKPLKGTVAENVLKYGTGGLNIDGCRIGTDENDKYDLEKRNISKAQGIKQDNSFLDAIHDKDMKHGVVEKGRFPANFIHDGSEEVVKLFPNSDGAGGSTPQSKITGFGKNISNGSYEYFGGSRNIFESGSGSAARFFYVAKASEKERNKGLGEDFPSIQKVFNGQSSEPSKDMKGVELKFSTRPQKNHHPTVKPIELMRYLVRLITPKGGIVLEPFAGSGSTCIAAKQEKMNYIGMEIDQQYVGIAEARIKSAVVEYDIFDFIGDEDVKPNEQQ